jgi:hypothetical protein
MRSKELGLDTAWRRWGGTGSVELLGVPLLGAKRSKKPMGQKQNDARARCDAILEEEEEI